MAATPFCPVSQSDLLTTPDRTFLSSLPDTCHRSRSFPAFKQSRFQRPSALVLLLDILAKPSFFCILFLLIWNPSIAVLTFLLPAFTARLGPSNSSWRCLESAEKERSDHHPLHPHTHTLPLQSIFAGEHLPLPSSYPLLIYSSFWIAAAQRKRRHALANPSAVLSQFGRLRNPIWGCTDADTALHCTSHRTALRLSFLSDFPSARQRTDFNETDLAIIRCSNHRFTNSRNNFGCADCLTSLERRPSKISQDGLRNEHGGERGQGP